MKTDIKKINNWFYRHGWHRENRGYEQYIWKEQDDCWIHDFDGKTYQLVNSTTILIWPGQKNISISNSAVWRSYDGEEKKFVSPYGDGYRFALTPDEIAKIKELYDALDSELQKARRAG